VDEEALAHWGLSRQKQIKMDTECFSETSRANLRTYTTSKPSRQLPSKMESLYAWFIVT